MPGEKKTFLCAKMGMGCFLEIHYKSPWTHLAFSLGYIRAVLKTVLKV
jgi:hypothetical protein